MIFVGIDWSERHHDVCLLDDDGAVIAQERVPEGIDGATQLQVLLAEHAATPADVVIGIETDRGLLATST